MWKFAYYACNSTILTDDEREQYFKTWLHRHNLTVLHDVEVKILEDQVLQESYEMEEISEPESETAGPSYRTKQSALSSETFHSWEQNS